MDAAIAPHSVPNERVRRVYTVAAAAFLFLAPFPSSAGWRTFALLVALAAVAWLAWRGGEPLGFTRLPRPVAIAALAWIAWCLASTAWSDNRPYTMEELRRELLYGIVAFAVFYAGMRTPGQAHVGIRALLAGALLLGALEWVRLLFPGVPLAWKYQAAQGYYSTHLVIAAPLLAIVAWPRPEGMGVGRSALAALAVGLLAGGLATENRMLWLALGVGTLVAFAAFRRVQAGAAPSHSTQPAFLFAIALIALLVAASWEYKSARYYPQADGPMSSLSLDERPAIWSSAEGPLLERLWIGHGFGREIVAPAIARGLAERGAVNRYDHAHNVFLDVALQLGLVGLASFVALLAALALAFAQAARVPGGAPLAIAGLAMLVAFVTKNLTDDFYHRPNSLVFWAVTGMLLGLATPPRGPAPPP
jgi:O-antigen ligase